MIRSCLRGFLVMSFVFVSALDAFAQDPSVIPPRTGFHPNREYLSELPWEHVDTLAGNVVLTFTDLTLPGNGGKSLQFQRVYNTQLLNPNNKNWTFGIAGLPMRITEKSPKYPLSGLPKFLPHCEMKLVD